MCSSRCPQSSHQETSRVLRWWTASAPTVSPPVSLWRFPLKALSCPTPTLITWDRSLITGSFLGSSRMTRSVSRSTYQSVSGTSPKKAWTSGCIWVAEQHSLETCRPLLFCCCHHFSASPFLKLQTILLFKRYAFSVSLPLLLPL